MISSAMMETTTTPPLPSPSPVRSPVERDVDVDVDANEEADEGHVEVVHPSSPDEVAAMASASGSPLRIRLDSGASATSSSASGSNKMNGGISLPGSPAVASASSSAAMAAPSPNSKSPACSPGVSTSSPPSLPSPPILFQPFLPNHKDTLRSALPFSIDNILKPTFGQRLQLLQSVAVAAAAAAAQQQQQQQQRVLPPNPLFGAAAAVANIKTEPIAASSPEPISSPPVPASAAGLNINNNRPVDLSSKQESAKKADSSPKKEGEGSSSGGDVPPGMVRGPNGQLWPAWVFCTRYSDRPSSGPRLRKVKKSKDEVTKASPKDKRPRTAFNSDQLARLKREFEENRYLNEERRKSLSQELGLNENQIKIWFQNKRAKIKKTSGSKGELAQMLAAQGLYNHSTVPVDEDEYPNM